MSLFPPTTGLSPRDALTSAALSLVLPAFPPYVGLTSKNTADKATTAGMSKYLSWG